MKLATIIGTSIGLYVGAVGFLVYMSKTDTNNPPKTFIIVSCLTIPPVVGGTIGHYASQ